MGAIASQITSLTIVYSTVYGDANERKHQSSASLAFVRGIHWGPHKWPVTRKMFPFDDVIMVLTNDNRAYAITYYYSRGWYKKNATPLLMHWSNFFSCTTLAVQKCVGVRKSAYFQRTSRSVYALLRTFTHSKFFWVSEYALLCTSWT